MNNIIRRFSILATVIVFFFGAYFFALAATQKDSDQDGAINSADVDDDSDGRPDCVEKKKYRKDTDNDGIRNGKESDDDNDGIADDDDAFLFDRDNDGMRNDADYKLPSSDKDDDRDGIRDKFELKKYRKDHDNDEVSDTDDTDDDRDGINDIHEANEMLRNHDNDEWKDRKDSDDDNDAIPDYQEATCDALWTVTVLTRSWTGEQLVDNGGGTVGHGLAIDSQNQLHSVWIGYSGVRLVAAYSRSEDGGVTWSTMQEVSDGSSSSSGAGVAIGPNDEVYIVWTKKFESGNYLYIRRSTDSGNTWSTPIKISSSESEDAATPSMSVDTTGRVHVTWHSGDTDITDGSEYAKIFYTHSDTNGENFSTPVQLNTNTTGHSAWPRFTLQGDGETVALAWRDNREDTDWDIYTAVSEDGGDTFTERAAITTSKVQWDPDIAVDRFGTLHLAYMAYDTNGVFIDYSSSTNAGLTWSTPVRLTEYFSRFPFWAVYPNIDTLWLFWKDERDRTSESDPQADVVLKYSTDFGATWSELDRVTDLGTIDVRFPSPAVGPLNIPYVTWSDERNGTDVNEELFILGRTQQ